MEVCAGGILVDKNKVLLLKKKDGSYCLPKGHVEEGETHEMTAIREVKEETNVDGEILFYVGDVSFSYRGNNGRITDKTVYWYLMEPLNFNISPERKEGFVWCGFKYYKAAIRLVKYSSEREIIRDAMMIYRELK
ncbi:MAG: NUDIX domain-containing protein [Ezakiella sp.]|nr:NUDIX domain-containing protein [Ezakiella sp.]MDY3923325.1 NUDIX domain-containing protein [Ezakiella sp.]